jgi:uncharacterized protein
MKSESLRIFKKWNRIIHRDFGYFFFGITIIYCISGIAINHKKDWNPNYIIQNKTVSLGETLTLSDISESRVLAMLDRFGEKNQYKKYYFPDRHTLKIFVYEGSYTFDLDTGNGYVEKISRRTVFYEFNFLHYNPGKWWTWYSDIFSVALILIAISGLFIINKSKNSLTRRGVWFILAGLLFPVLALILL